MRATGRITGLSGTGRIPRMSATARMLQGTLAPAAQVGRIADSVEGEEGHDPTGIRLEAADLPDGSGMRVALATAAEASATPDLGVGWSAPMVDIAGRRIPEVGAFLVEGFVRAILRAPPAQLAAPSQMYAWVGWTSDGPLATATRGLAFRAANRVAGGWACDWYTLSNGTWSLGGTAFTGSALVTGVHGVWTPGNVAGSTRSVGAMALGTLNTNHGHSAFPAVMLGGSDPHIIWGVGWAAVPSAPDELVFSVAADLRAPGSPT